MAWAPRITMPASVSCTTPGWRNGSGCWCAGVRAVDLRRHDGVGDVEVLVPRLLVEAHDVVAEARPGSVEELAPAREAGEHRGHVVGRPPHQAVRALGPEPVDGPPPSEVLGRAGDQPHRADPPSAGGIDALRDIGRLAPRPRSARRRGGSARRRPDAPSRPRRAHRRGTRRARRAGWRRSRPPDACRDSRTSS